MSNVQTLRNDAPPPRLYKKDNVIEWVRVGEMAVIYPEAQRPFDAVEAAVIADKFNNNAFGIITLSAKLSGGKYHIIDGQTRVGAINLMFNDPNQRVQCRITDARTAQECAVIFDWLNAHRTKPSAHSRFKVAVTAKLEPEKSISNMLTQLGYRVGASNSEGCIRAIEACIGIAKKYDVETLREALSLIKLTWGLEHTATDGNILRAIVIILKEKSKEIGPIDKAKFASKIEKHYTPARLLGAGRQAKDLFRGSIYQAIANLLMDEYQKGKRGK